MTAKPEAAPREVLRLHAERIFDLVEGLPSWGSMSDDKVRDARARCLDNIQGEIAAAAHAAGRAEGEALAVALEVFVQLSDWCSKSDLPYHAEAFMIFRDRVETARAALARWRGR